MSRLNVGKISGLPLSHCSANRVEDVVFKKEGRLLVNTKGERCQSSDTGSGFNSYKLLFVDEGAT